MDKRGIELTQNTLIVIIISVIVLLIVVVSFTGGVANAFNKIKEVLFRGGAVSLDAAVEQCNSNCQLEAPRAFCKQIKILDQDQPKNCAQLGVSCPGIVCCETVSVCPTPTDNTKKAECDSTYKYCKEVPK